MTKESNNRLHPLIVLKNTQGVIINEFCEEKIFAGYFENKSLNTLKTGTKLIVDEIQYTVDCIVLDYSKIMHGDFGTPVIYEGEFEHYNLRISIILKS